MGVEPTSACCCCPPFHSTLVNALACCGLRFVEQRLAINPAPIWDLLRRYARCYPRMKALSVTLPRTHLRCLFCNALIGGCPLLITPGQCAELLDEESEDLTGVWPLGYCQELFIVCIYLCGQFLKCRKVANVTKTGKSTDERRHSSTSTFRICAIRGMRIAVCLMLLPDFANKKAPSD